MQLSIFYLVANHVAFGGAIVNALTKPPTTGKFVYVTCNGKKRSVMIVKLQTVLCCRVRSALDVIRHTDLELK